MTGETGRGVNRFNLTFSGEILAGHDPAQVRLRFANLFEIDDPVRLERFFSGETIVLRRNLERKAAAQCYHELHLIGALAALVKVADSETQPPNTLTTPRAKPAAKTADIAAGIKARKLETQRQVAETAARARSARAEQERKAAEDAARKEAETAERERRAQAEAARLAAERQRQAEEAVRQAAEEAARTRQAAAEAAARKLAIREEARRKAAEEERLRKALRQQQKAERELRKAEAAARRKAEQEEKKRREAAAEARRKAELEEKQRREAEETARRKAELEAQQRQAEEAARRQAELEELQRREAEEDARLQAELAAITQRAADEAAQLQAEVEAQARLAAAQAARITEAARQQQQEAQRHSAERRLAIAQSLAATQANRQRAATAVPSSSTTAASVQSVAAPLRKPPQPAPAHPAPPASSRPGKRRIRTALDVPPRTTRQTGHIAAPESRKRQPGEPNVYKLRPFRHTDAVRTRGALAQQRAWQCYTLGLAALLALLVLGTGFLQRTLSPAVPGARAVSIDPHSGPLLLSQDALLLHDRAGVGTGVLSFDALGLDAFDPPLAFDTDGALLGMGHRKGDPNAGRERQLLRCNLANAQCAPFSSQLADNSIDAFTLNAVDGSTLLADRSVGLLLKVGRDGAITARAEVAFAERLTLRLHSGLLLMNSATAPAISVLRYENAAFGQQLDEILLLPPGVEQADKLRVGDFLWSGGHWWVSFYDIESGTTGVYRFDEEWNFRDKMNLPSPTAALQLIDWGQKILVNDPQRPTLQRINTQGVLEAPFVSEQLESASAAVQRRARLAEFAWRAALLLCALGVALGLGSGYLQRRRALVYQSRREQGAEPLDAHVDALQWIDPAPNRQAQLRRCAGGYAALAAGVLLLAVAQNVGVWQLAALLLALCGPASALLLLSRRGTGHIGIQGERLVLVDHSGTYHIGGGSRVQYRGAFLAIDDVVVFCGSRILPAFSQLQIQTQVRPLALSGVKVDRDTLLVKLLQSRHPLALGALAILAALAVATAVLCLQATA